jgi:hypothetical protein
MLTSDRESLRHALRRHEGLRLEREIPVTIRGMGAAMHVLRKT